MKIEINYDTDGMTFGQLSKLYFKLRETILAVNKERNKIQDRMYELMERLRFIAEDPKGKFNSNFEDKDNQTIVQETVEELEENDYPWRNYFDDEDQGTIEFFLPEY